MEFPVVHIDTPIIVMIIKHFYYTNDKISQI